MLLYLSKKYLPLDHSNKQKFNIMKTKLENFAIIIGATTIVVLSGIFIYELIVNQINFM